jgi:hypothetical protein
MARAPIYVRHLTDDERAVLKSESVIYRPMAARSRVLWGENVHRFYQVVGIIVIVFGALVALG